jgi:multimeric flavodoxin WrbA
MKKNLEVKILGISASGRHANTELAVKEALKAAEGVGYAKTEFVSLADYKLVPCVGCMKCFGWQHPADGGLECYEFKDDSGIILHKMAECDGLIFGAPVYVVGINALAKIIMDKASMFGPMSFTRQCGDMRLKPLGVIAVGGGDSGGQEIVGLELRTWGHSIGMVTVGPWPTRQDPNPQCSTYGAFPTTTDAVNVYAKNGITKEATRTIPPTQGARNMKSIRNTGKHVAQMAMILKMGKQAFKGSGLKELELIPFPRYSVKPKPGSWIQKLVDEGKVELVTKEKSTGKK